MEQLDLQHVKLADVTLSETNKMFRESADMQQAALQELIDSIKKDGVLQPVLLRTNGKAGKYELVCGERRYRASQANKLETIPAYIRTLNDDQALDAQLTENLQRKDVHPMKEARAYKFLISKDPKVNNVASLALRFGKSETYILTRLKLNDLVEEASNDFESGVMSLGHALLIAKLQPADQKELIKDCSRGGKKDRYYETIQELHDHIDRNVLRNLSAAPWKKDDATLTKAGACTLCPKRSGCQPWLFGDITKETDRCLDPTCYQDKLNTHTRYQVSRLIEEKPETLFVAEGYGDKPDKLILDTLKNNGIKLLENYSTWNGNGGKKVSAFMVNGDEVGKMITVYVKGQAPKKGKDGEPEKIDVKAAIAGIRERTKRAQELDDEKVYVRILEGLQKSKSMKADTAPKELPIDKVLMRWIILQHAGYDKHYLSGHNFGGSADAQIKAIAKISDKDFIQVARKILLKEYSGQAPNVRTAGGKILWQLAEALGEVPVKAFVSDQTVIRSKREDRANERIAALQPKKKGAKHGK